MATPPLLTLHICPQDFRIWNGKTSHIVNGKVRGGKLTFCLDPRAPVSNYSPGTGRVEVYALYGNVIDYNCPLNINQVY